MQPGAATTVTIMETKALSSQLQASARERSEALIAARTRALFERVPSLLAFSYDIDLAAYQVELQPWPGYSWGREIYDEVRVLLGDFALELAAEVVQGEELLRGRTFARHLH